MGLLPAPQWASDVPAGAELCAAALVLSVGYNTGLAILGGLTPLVAVYTINRSQYDLSPAFLLMAAAAISFAVVLGLRETYKMPLATPATAAAEAA